MKKHILIVDNDPAVRESLQRTLVAAAYDVTAKANGRFAESELLRTDLVVLALNLPIQDGWDVLGRVNAGYPLLPVIVITALVDQLDEQSIPGASAFLEKPVAASLLLETVERLLSPTAGEHVEKTGRGSERWPLPVGQIGLSENTQNAAPRAVRRLGSI